MLRRSDWQDGQAELKGEDLKDNLFTRLSPDVVTNTKLREPQKLAYAALADHDFTSADGREVGVVLPVGCGKSGLLAIAPFATKSKRTLLIAPNLRIAGQLLADLTPSDPDFFYVKRGVLATSPYPEPAEIRGATTNLTDLEDADIVVTNIQQLQRENNRWLTRLPADFFDLIQFDEAHHNVAESWDTLREKFPAANIINVSATPSRADGRLMAGQIIYSYPISEAVKNGFVKRVNGHRLNPKTLRYVRNEGGNEIEVDLDEVRRLGETDAGFRRSIVSSDETLTTIVDASIRQLNSLRAKTGEKRLKIIASALNMDHCKQIVAKYKERNLRADFVHSNLSGKANEVVHQKLDNHELDVIVQVRKLGEGFDHPYLTVAAVFSIFANLSPFVQFVGRIMRVIPDVDPFDPVNEGVVVFHVGGNITGVWSDFKEFAESDQEFFANLTDEDLVELDPSTGTGGTGSDGPLPLPVITSQSDVRLEDLSLLSVDPKVAAALQVLKDAGVSTEQYEELQKIQPTKQAARQSKRKLLDERVKTAVGRILKAHDLNNVGHDLDTARLNKDNFVILKAAIDRVINSAPVTEGKSRQNLSREQLDDLLSNLDSHIAKAESAVFDGR